MARSCAREVDDQYCGRPFSASRVITDQIHPDATTGPVLTYRVDLCDEHATEYDAEHPAPLPAWIRNFGGPPNF